MAKYISKKAVLDALKQERKNGNFVFTSKWIKEIMDTAPAADVVEVVRCKDCVSYNGHRYCNYHADPVMDDDFCSYGERKVGEKQWRSNMLKQDNMKQSSKK